MTGPTPFKPQEWEAKAKQARKNYDRVMQEYKAKQSSSPSK